MDNQAIKKLESDLWESADLLRAGSKLTSQQYCMPVLGLLFLRYAYSRFKKVEEQILKGRPVRNGRVLPVEASDFAEKSALFLPLMAQYSWLVGLPENIPAAHLTTESGQPLNSLGEVVNHAMELVEAQSAQLNGVLPREYTIFSDELLAELLRIFNNDELDQVGGDVIGRIYEYFLSKFAPVVASDDGVFFTPKSLVKMIVNVIEPSSGTLLDCACGSGGMFIQSGDFVNAQGMSANKSMTFYGQEKVEYNAKLCLMNMAVHGLTGMIKSGDAANTFYHDAHNLAGCCDYVMANPPFNVDKVKAEAAQNAGRLPFGLPAVNAAGEFGNANYLWISYFYAYLNEHGRAGFVMASSATDSQSKDKNIREQLVKTGHVDVMISVGNNFFYTKSLPCSLWFFDKGKPEVLRDKVLFIDARNYFTVVDRNLNEWNEWQLKNLTAIVWLYRQENEKYCALLQEYVTEICLKLKQVAISIRDLNSLLYDYKGDLDDTADALNRIADDNGLEPFTKAKEILEKYKEAFDANRKRLEDYLGSLEKKEAAAYIKNTMASSSWNVYKKKLVEASDALFHTNNTQAGTAAELLTIIQEYEWLRMNFPNDVYCDVPGLCKIAYTTDEAQGENEGISIESKSWSLTPGAYVGVAPVADDGVDFHARMKEIHEELKALQAKSNELMETISRNMEEMGL